MTREEVDKLNITNKNGTFPPIYTYKIIEKEIDGEIVKIEDYTITQTAEENYQDYLNNKNKPQATETELLQKQLLETQAIVAELKYKSIMKENGGI